MQQLKKTWEMEVQGMRIAAKTDSERLAIECLERALQPLFDDSSKLRTMLGKIQMELLSADVEEQLVTKDFTSVTELSNLLPANVSAHLEAAI